VAAAPRLWSCLEAPLTLAQLAADLWRYQSTILYHWSVITTYKMFNWSWSSIPAMLNPVHLGGRRTLPPRGPVRHLIRCFACRMDNFCDTVYLYDITFAQIPDRLGGTDFGIICSREPKRRPHNIHEWIAY
jgi:hypothetical protein